MTLKASLSGQYVCAFALLIASGKSLAKHCNALQLSTGWRHTVNMEAESAHCRLKWLISVL